MIAKPLIDIDIALPGLEHIEDATRRLLAEGYEPRGNRYDDEVYSAARLFRRAMDAVAL